LTDLKVEDFFPEEGTWRYKITVGEVEPVVRQTVKCGDSDTTFGIEGRFLGLVVEPERKEFSLEYRAVGKVPEPDWLVEGAWPEEGYAIGFEVLEDELGVFDWVAEACWLVDTQENRVMLELGFPDSPAAPCSTGMYSYSSRLAVLERAVFYVGGKKSGLVSGWGSDVLWILGFDTKLEGYEGEMVVVFTRWLDLEGGISEDMWYAEGIGLVRLEQIQLSPGGEEQLAMTWELEEYTK